MYGTENLIAVDHAPVAVVDYDAETDRAFERDQNVRFVAGSDARFRIVDERFQVGRCDGPAGDVVRVDVDDVFLADLDASLLVAVRQEQVLGRNPPVEKGPVHGFVDRFQKGGLSDCRQRPLGRGDEPVLRVVVDEHFLAVSDSVGERDEAVREKHLVPLLVAQIKPVVRNSADGQRMVVSCGQHKRDFLQSYVISADYSSSGRIFSREKCPTACRSGS